MLRYYNPKRKLSLKLGRRVKSKLKSIHLACEDIWDVNDFWLESANARAYCQYGFNEIKLLIGFMIFHQTVRAYFYGGLEGTSSLIFNSRLLFSIRDFYFQFATSVFNLRFHFFRDFCFRTRFLFSCRYYSE